MISAILAISKNNCIGKNNMLPWPHIKEDMEWFQEKTQNNVVVMGSNTWNSLGIRKPLKNRVNIVISSHELSNFPGAKDVFSCKLPDEIKSLEICYPRKEIFVIGGSQVYKLCAPIIDIWYVTRIDEEYDGDTFLQLDELLTLTGCKFIDQLSPKKQIKKLPKYTWEVYKK